MRRKPIRKRRISPNPRRNFFCGFFVFWKFLQARYNFVRSFLQMGAMYGMIKVQQRTKMRSDCRKTAKTADAFGAQTGENL